MESPETTVRRSVVVEAPIDRAFTFFTRDIGMWWEEGKHLLDEPVAEMVFEPRVGGHIIDRGISGKENRWATVLAYDPPAHVAFSWSIDLTWQIEPDLAKSSEVHVTFTDQGEQRTLVELEHRHLDRHGEGWEAMRDAVGSPNGWNLEPFAVAIATADDYRNRFTTVSSVDAFTRALTDADEIRAWWTSITRCEQDGTTIRAFMRSDRPLVFSTASTPDGTQVTWSVLECDFLPDWVGTTLTFTACSAAESALQVSFHHAGLSPVLDCFDQCQAGWNHFIPSLHRYLDTGVGLPNEPRITG